MSLELHPECRKRLSERLSAALTSIKVRNGKFLDYETTHVLSGVDSVLPGGELRKTLSRYVSELPFSDFVRGALELSHSGSDEMLSFVQAAVVLEILLGDKATSDVIGLGELLRNRCAYLISRSPLERERILSDFARIYDVRSKIVHEGKKRLNLDEWKLFSRLRWICQRVIREEARLLARPNFD
jgi:hypothetical protein